MGVLLYIFFGLVGCILWWFIRYVIFRNPKSPSSLPFIGHAHLMQPHCLLTSFRTWMDTIGDVVEVSALGKRVVILSDPKIINEVLMKRPRYFVRGASPITIEKLRLHNDVFFAEGEDWSRLRRVGAPSFSKQNIALMCTSICEEIKALITRMESSSEMEIGEVMFYFTLRVISKVALGNPTGPTKIYLESRQMHDDVREVFQYLVTRRLFFLPNWIWNSIPSLVKLEQQAILSDTRLHDACQEIINNLKANPSSGEKRSLLEVLLAHAGDQTDEELISTMKGFFRAGSETTAVTLTYALYYLSKRSDLINALREELQRVMGPSGGIPCTTDQIAQLVVSSAVIKECLRMTGPAPFLSHRLPPNTPPVTLSNGITLSPGEDCYTYFEGAHHHADVFPDPDTFKPERWLNADPKELAKMQASLYSFGGGSRICPGMNLSLTEAVMALSSIVWYFDFALNCPESEIQRVLNFTAKLKALPMKVTRRRV